MINLTKAKAKINDLENYFFQHNFFLIIIQLDLNKRVEWSGWIEKGKLGMLQIICYCYLLDKFMKQIQCHGSLIKSLKKWYGKLFFLRHLIHDIS